MTKAPSVSSVLQPLAGKLARPRAVGEQMLLPSRGDSCCQRAGCCQAGAVLHPCFLVLSPALRTAVSARVVAAVVRIYCYRYVTLQIYSLPPEMLFLPEPSLPLITAKKMALTLYVFPKPTAKS